MKKIILAFLFTTALCVSVFGHRPPHGGFRHPAPVHHYGPRVHHHHHGYVAPLAFGAGLVLGSVLNPAPVITPSRVWIPGYYVTNYDAYGNQYQTYIPGHWEYR